MALFIRQDEQRSQLRSKVTADLQERMRRTAELEATDVSKDATILQNQHQTRGVGVIVTIVVIIAVVVTLYLLR
jgi:hypothetical protein